MPEMLKDMLCLIGICYMLIHFGLLIRSVARAIREQKEACFEYLSH